MKILTRIAPLFLFAVLASPASGFGAENAAVYVCEARSNQNISLSGSDEILNEAWSETRSSKLIFKIWPMEKGKKGEVEAALYLSNEKGWDIDIIRDPNRPTNVTIGKILKLDSKALKLSGVLANSVRYWMSAELNRESLEAKVEIKAWLARTSLKAAYRDCKLISQGD